MKGSHDDGLDLAEIRGRMELAQTKAEDALPAYERFVKHGTRDPAGYDLPTPPRDPNEPVMECPWGNLMVVDKGYTLEIKDGRFVPSEPKMTKLETPSMKKAVDLNDAAVGAQLNHLHGRKS